MKKTKQVLSIILAVVMVICAVPVMQAGAATNTPYYNWKQYDNAWGGNYIGSKTIKAVGCVATSIAMLIVQAGFRNESNFDPGTFVSEMKAINGFSNNDIYWAKVSQISGCSGFTYAGSYSLTGTESQKIAAIKQRVDAGYSVVCSVKNEAHKVAVRSASSSRVTMMDPASTETDLYGYYSASNSTRMYLYQGKGSYTPDYEDLGEHFWAYIIKRDSWKHLECAGYNVQLAAGGNDSHDPKQIWEFTKQSDGSYVIKNAYGDRCIDAEGWGTSNGTNVCANGSNGTTAQKWYIVKNEDAFYLKTSYSDMVMDVTSNSNEPGANVELWTKNTSEAQRFSIYKLTADGINYSKPAKPAASTISVKTLGTSNTKTVLQWTASPLKSTNFDKRVYDIRIWKGLSTDGSAYHTKLGLTGATYEITLPEGSYTAKVYAVNAKYYEWWAGSSEITFTIQGSALVPASTPANIGNVFYATIETLNAWKPIQTDYKTDSYVRLASSVHNQNSAHQFWRFERQNDGSYSIRSTQDGNCLEFHNGERYENAPVSAHNTWWNGAYQKWWLYESGNGGFFIKSDHYTSEGWYLTLKDNNPADGTPITMCKLTGNANQVWGIYKGNEIQLKAPTLTVKEGTSTTATQFSWEHIFGAKEFKVDVWKNQYSEGKAPDYTSTVTTTSGSIQLPGGTYEARVTASNFWESYTSQGISFAVESEHAHAYSSVITKSATCITTGVETLYCFCGDISTETIPINSNNHVNTMNVAATPSTCTTQGYSFGVYCNDCKKYISGHEAQPLAAHQTTLINAKAATYDATGYTGDQYCAVCKQTITYGTVIPKLTKPDEPTNPTQPTNPAPQPQPQPSGGCAYCGQTHTGFPGILIGFFHSILALFGLRK